MVSHTLPILVGVLVAYVALAGLFVLTSRSRKASAVPTGEVDTYLRRTDLLDEGRRPSDPLEWVIVLSQRAKVLGGLILVVAIVTAVLAMTIYPAAVLLGGYFLAMLVVTMLLFFGWDIIESAYGGSSFEPSTGGSRISAGGLPDETRARLQHRGVTKQEEEYSRWDNLGISDIWVTLTIVFILVVLMSVAMTLLVFFG